MSKSLKKKFTSLKPRGDKDLDDVKKIKRLYQWCESINQVQKKMKITPLYVKQQEYEKYKPSDLSGLVFTLSQGWLKNRIEQKEQESGGNEHKQNWIKRNGVLLGFFSRPSFSAGTEKSGCPVRFGSSVPASKNLTGKAYKASMETLRLPVNQENARLSGCPRVDFPKKYRTFFNERLSPEIRR